MANVTVMDHPMTPGAVLRRWREGVGIKQAELARRLHVSAPSISDWEADKKLPRIEHAIALANASDGEVPVSVWVRSKGEAA